MDRDHSDPPGPVGEPAESDLVAGDAVSGDLGRDRAARRGWTFPRKQEPLTGPLLASGWTRLDPGAGYCQMEGKDRIPSANSPEGGKWPLPLSFRAMAVA